MKLNQLYRSGIGITLLVLLGMLPALGFGQQSDSQSYLPFVVRPRASATATPSPTPTTTPGPSPAAGSRVASAPYFNGEIPFAETSIFWFGQVTTDSNYTDVRVGYNNDHLYIYLAAFDRRLWYDADPTANDLTNWDSATLYLQTDDAQSLNTQSIRIDAQLNNGENKAYTAIYRADSGGWQTAALTIQTEAAWRGERLNEDTDDRGWGMGYTIPFSSLGLSGPPAQGSTWRMALVVHDRDTQQGPKLSDSMWPEQAKLNSPTTWGRLRFGLQSYTPPAVQSTQSYTIRHGLNGTQVHDASVGGGSICGEGLDFWTEWGSKNRAGEGDAAVQNQSDIADWPCYSKFYLTIPLDKIPADAKIVSAELVLHQMGNSGMASNGQLPPSSYIQVLSIGDNWNEQTITWNNAPYAVDTISRTWVDVIEGCGAVGGIAWPCVPRQFDVSRAVAEARANGQPLRIVLYAADSDYSTGKYFTTSDTGNWNAEGRPTLIVKAGK